MALRATKKFNFFVAIKINDVRKYSLEQPRQIGIQFIMIEGGVQ